MGVAKVLIEYKADLNAQDNSKSTPLHLASRKENDDGSKLLENSEISNVAS